MAINSIHHAVLQNVTVYLLYQNIIWTVIQICMIPMDRVHDNHCIALFCVCVFGCFALK